MSVFAFTFSDVFFVPMVMAHFIFIFIFCFTLILVEFQREQKLTCVQSVVFNLKSTIFFNRHLRKFKTVIRYLLYAKPLVRELLLEFLVLTTIIQNMFQSSLKQTLKYFCQAINLLNK